VIDPQPFIDLIPLALYWASKISYSIIDTLVFYSNSQPVEIEALLFVITYVIPVITGLFSWRLIKANLFQ